MRRVLRFFVRVTSFLRKEIFAIVRQPRLIFTLVLGPFLILLLFGLGFKSTQIPLRTLFVVPEGSELRPLVETEGDALVRQLVPVGITSDRDDALERLRRGKVELVVMVPAQISDVVRKNRRAQFDIYHDALDPIQISYIESFSATFTQSFNHRLLLYLTRNAKERIPEMESRLAVMRETLSLGRQAFERGDFAAFEERRRQLQEEMDALASGLELYGWLLAGLREIMGRENMLAHADPDLMSEIVQTNLQSLDGAQEQLPSEIAAELGTLEDNLETLRATLRELDGLDPAVLISPFITETTGLSSENLGVTDYYAPSVLVLLMQHLSITFAGLSIVQDRRLGVMELFQTSPLSPFEILLGKYLSYTVFTGLISAVLTSLLIYGLGVPLRGAVSDFVLVNAVFIFASLGIGFVISLLAETTSQAVQYAMIVLLASVFFTGFFLSLELMADWIQGISWLLPATYGVRWLQKIMLRGLPPDSELLLTLGGFGVALFIIAWILLRRLMTRK